MVMCGTMDFDKKPLDFAEIDLTGDPEQGEGKLQGMTIPERKEHPKEAPIPYVKALPREQLFVQQAKVFANRTGEQVPFVPFMSYWPTYDQMNEEQLSWYLYWRTEVREDQYLFTDLSYIFVYLYELIHGIGWDQPWDGYEMMMRLWNAYAKRYPKLNGYLADWVCDFALVHQLDIPFMDILSRSQAAKTGELFDLELERRFTEDPSSLTLEEILTLSDYDAERSKFYAEGGRDLMEKFTPNVIALVDSYMQRTTGKKLVHTFYKGQGRKVDRYLFRNALYDASLYGKTFTLHIAPLRKCPPLRFYITQLLRCTENKLRELTQFKGRLRGVTLLSETETLIQKYLTKEFTTEQPAVPGISIDPGRLAALQQESEEVRSMLTVEGWNDETDPAALDSDPPAAAEGSSDSAILVPFHENEPPEEQRTVPYHPSSEERTIGVWDTEQVEPEWTEFAEQLEPVHLEVLQALISRAALHELQQIADKYGTMPALLLDEINSIAMDTIGDLVIDGESISEDYEHVFESWKR